MVASLIAIVHSVGGPGHDEVELRREVPQRRPFV
jgi:hypothetical protein